MGTTAPASMPHADKMTTQTALMADGCLKSENGDYKMIMQGDGNLVLYNNDDEPLWASGTNGDYGAHCIFQEDGHFLIYRCDEDGRVSTNPDDCIWKTDIYGDPSDFHHGWVCMQNDGNFVQYNKRGTPLWCTRTDGGQQGSREGGFDRC